MPGQEHGRFTPSRLGQTEHTPPVARGVQCPFRQSRRDGTISENHQRERVFADSARLLDAELRAQLAQHRLRVLEADENEPPPALIERLLDHG